MSQAANIRTLRPGSRRERLLKESLAAAGEIIREKVDQEGKYIPTALYEVTGDELREHLAYAFRKGRDAKRGAR